MTDYAAKHHRHSARFFLIIYVAVATCGCASSKGHDAQTVDRPLTGCVEDVSARQMSVVREGTHCLEVHTTVFDCPNGAARNRVPVRDEIPVECPLQPSSR